MVVPADWGPPGHLAAVLATNPSTCTPLLHWWICLLHHVFFWKCQRSTFSLFLNCQESIPPNLWLAVGKLRLSYFHTIWHDLEMTPRCTDSALKLAPRSVGGQRNIFIWSRVASGNAVVGWSIISKYQSNKQQNPQDGCKVNKCITATSNIKAMNYLTLAYFYCVNMHKIIMKNILANNFLIRFRNKSLVIRKPRMWGTPYLKVSVSSVHNI